MTVPIIGQKRLMLSGDMSVLLHSFVIDNTTPLDTLLGILSENIGSTLCGNLETILNTGRRPMMKLTSYERDRRVNDYAIIDEYSTFIFSVVDLLQELFYRKITAAIDPNKIVDLERFDQRLIIDNDMTKGLYVLGVCIFYKKE